MKSITEMEDSLREMLLEEAQFNSSTRTEMLVNHLRDYLERLFCFSMLYKGSLAPLLTGNMFGCVVAAINVFDEDFRASNNLTGGAAERWREFKNTVEWLKRGPSQEDLKLVEQTFVVFAEAALSKSIEFDIRPPIPIKSLGITGIE